MNARKSIKFTIILQYQPIYGVFYQIMTNLISLWSGKRSNSRKFMEWKFVSAVRRQFYIENMRKNFQFSLILISVTLIGLQIYLTLFFSKHKVNISSQWQNNHIIWFIWTMWYGLIGMLHIICNILKILGVLKPKVHPKDTLSSWIEDVCLAAYLLTPHLIRHMCRLTKYLTPCKSHVIKENIISRDFTPPISMEARLWF